MKIRTVLVAATAAGIGYVMGTAAGRARFEQIRGQAKDFLGSPQVQDTVANLSDTVKQSASKLPDPVAGVVNAVADKAKSSTTGQSTQDAAPSTSDLPETSFASDLPETSFASDLPETSFASDLPTTSSTLEPETPLVSEYSETPLTSDFTGADDATIPPTTTPPTPPR